MYDLLRLLFGTMMFEDAPAGPDADKSTNKDTPDPEKEKDTDKDNDEPQETEAEKGLRKEIERLRREKSAAEKRAKDLENKGKTEAELLQEEVETLRKSNRVAVLKAEAARLGFENPGKVAGYIPADVDVMDESAVSAAFDNLVTDLGIEKKRTTSAPPAPSAGGGGETEKAPTLSQLMMAKRRLDVSKKK